MQVAMRSFLQSVPCLLASDCADPGCTFAHPRGLRRSDFLQVPIPCEREIQTRIAISHLDGFSAEIALLIYAYGMSHRVCHTCRGTEYLHRFEPERCKPTCPFLTNVTSFDEADSEQWPSQDKAVSSLLEQIDAMGCVDFRKATLWRLIMTVQRGGFQSAGEMWEEEWEFVAKSLRSRLERISSEKRIKNELELLDVLESLYKTSIYGSTRLVLPIYDDIALDTLLEGAPANFLDNYLVQVRDSFKCSRWGVPWEDILNESNEKTRFAINLMRRGARLKTQRAWERNLKQCVEDSFFSWRVAQQEIIYSARDITHEVLRAHCLPVMIEIIFAYSEDTSPSELLGCRAVVRSPFPLLRRSDDDSYFFHCAEVSQNIVLIASTHAEAIANDLRSLVQAWSAPVMLSANAVHSRLVTTLKLSGIANSYQDEVLLNVHCMDCKKPIGWFPVARFDGRLCACFTPKGFVCVVQGKSVSSKLRQVEEALASSNIDVLFVPPEISSKLNSTHRTQVSEKFSCVLGDKCLVCMEGLCSCPVGCYLQITCMNGVTMHTKEEILKMFDSIATLVTGPTSGNTQRKRKAT